MKPDRGPLEPLRNEALLALTLPDFDLLIEDQHVDQADAMGMGGRAPAKARISFVASCSLFLVWVKENT